MRSKVLVTTDEKGKNLVVLPHVIFEGKRSISWDEVERYLLQYIGDIVKISETQDLIYIGRDFADEFAHSKYTEKLRGALAKTKANMVQGIHGMIENAENRRWNEDFEKRHGQKAAKGWYRYDTRFAMPIMNGSGDIIRYNIHNQEIVRTCIERGILVDFMKKYGTRGIEILCKEMTVEEAKILSYEAGIEQGIEQGENNIIRLHQRLMEQNRMEDLKRSLEDEEYRRQLLRELFPDSTVK